MDHALLSPRQGPSGVALALLEMASNRACQSAGADDADKACGAGRDSGAVVTGAGVACPLRRVDSCLGEMVSTLRGVLPLLSKPGLPPRPVGVCRGIALAGMMSASYPWQIALQNA